MPESECMRIRLKTGMTDKFLAWAKQLPNRMDEVKIGMHEQGIIAEHIFLERSTEGDFIVFYVKADDLVKTRDIFQRSQRTIDVEFRHIVDETWDRSQVSRLEPVMEL